MWGSSWLRTGAGNRARHISEAAPARLTYELMEVFRSGHAAGIWAKWREFGLMSEAFPELIESPDLVPRILERIDRRIAGGGRLGDATILASLFLPRFSRLLEEMTGGGQGRLNNVEFMDRLKVILEPASTRMLVSNHTMHLMFHGLFILTKMRRAPERGRQVIKLSRHESFSVAWDLLGLGVSVGLFSEAGRKAWEAALDQVRRSPDSEAPTLEVDTVRRTRRRKRRRKPRVVEKSE
ncbi:MAG: hypothetical protein K8R59_14440 [Thermoanaerobaculales bacterium]|nr:hypothetical protein [Thermoanaerobaculales bacterium]